MTDPEPPGECCFDEWAARNAERARRKETVAPITTAMLAAIETEGLEGRAILDIGCGAGDLALAALAHGANRAYGRDLVYAVSAPVDRGLVGIWNRIVVWVSNVWYAIRPAKFKGFRVFVHDLTDVDERIGRAGFALTTAHRRRVVWRLAVYVRPGSRASR